MTTFEEILDHYLIAKELEASASADVTQGLQWLLTYSDRICDYISEKFNKQYEKDIQNYYCQSTNPDDVHIDWDAGVVTLSSENPRTNHPYDRVDMVISIREVTKEIDIENYLLTT
jgi:hypothetical protein